MSTVDVDVTKSKDASNPSNKYVISETQLGIWKIFIAKKGAQSVLSEIWETYPLIIRLIVDIYTISPRLLYLLLLTRCWDGVELALQMRLENILLAQIELAVSTGKANVYTTVLAVGCKVLHSVIGSYSRWYEEYVIPTLKNQLKQHFHIELMTTKLMTDLPTSAETPEHEVTSHTALSSLEKIFEILKVVFEVFSQIQLLLEVSRMNGAGNMLFLGLLLQAIISHFSYMALWKLAFFAHINDENYIRSQSIDCFANGSFRQDIISNNLRNWIIAECRKAFAAIGDTPTDDVFTLYFQKTSRFGIIQDILKGFPIIYFAIVVIYYPQHFSLAAIVTLQSSGRSLLSSVGILFFEIDNIREGLYSLRRLYAPKTPNIMKDGTFRLTEAEDTSPKGMTLVLKDVSFAYPSGENKKNALSGINLDIKAGQLVVVVGANGSGKSTLTRILSRLYDPSSGEFLVEGRPSTEYNVADLHLSTTLLTQDSQIFPLTLAENIGLGYPERFSDLEMIKEAAAEGGAAEFIEGLEKGYQTMLETFDSSFHMNLNGDREHPLWVMSDKMTKKSDISGGQRQRVIAARTFMRFKSGRVKLVIVDEPSSALDADAELQLFQRLISAREGKTMVFVTHRFGHLTKFADQIICMKDGTIVESGSHGELMSAAGEYAKLYKIQAQAFSEGQTDSTVGCTGKCPGCKG